MTASTSSSYNLTSSANGLASFSGLASGIDTTSLINNLMALEAAPQAALKTRLSSNQAVTSALQALNTKLAALATSATTMGTSATLDARAATATSSADTAAAKAFSVTVTGTPPTGSLDVQVTATAASERHEFTGNTGTAAGWNPPTRTGSPATYPITLVAGGQTTVLQAASYSAVDVADAINRSTSGVAAAPITGSDGVPRLVLTAPSGSYPSFSLTLKDSGDADVASGQHANAATDVSGADAAITVNGISLTSKSNTFTNVLTGLDLALGAPAIAAVAGGGTPTGSVSVTANQAATASAVAGVVTQIASLLTDIAFQTKAPPAGTPASATNGGLLAGNSTLQRITAALSQAVSDASSSAGATTASTGLELTRDGASVVADTTKLTQFLTANPALGRTLLTTLSGAVKDVATAASKAGSADDPATGDLSRMIADLGSRNSGLTAAIAGWDDRLAQRKANLTARYAAMETALSKLQSQSSALTSALKQFEQSS